MWLGCCLATIVGTMCTQLYTNLYSIAKQVKQHELNMHHWDASSTIFFFLLYICVCIHVCVHVCVCVSVYVSMCVYMCVCVCVSVRMCVCHCAQCGPTPLATFLLLQDMFFFYSPIPPPHTYRVVFALSIIIRSSCTCSYFSSSSLSFEKLPRKSCNKSMHTFVSKFHPPPTLHAKEGSTLPKTSSSIRRWC